MYILAHARISIIHKNPVRVRLLSLPDTKNASPVPFWTALISTLKFPEWTMKSSVVIEWGSHLNASVLVYKARVTCK